MSSQIRFFYCHSGKETIIRHVRLFWHHSPRATGRGLQTGNRKGAGREELQIASNDELHKQAGNEVVSARNSERDAGREQQRALADAFEDFADVPIPREPKSKYAANLEVVRVDQRPKGEAAADQRHLSKSAALVRKAKSDVVNLCSDSEGSFHDVWCMVTDDDDDADCCIID